MHDLLLTTAPSLQLQNQFAQSSAEPHDLPAGVLGLVSVVLPDEPLLPLLLPPPLLLLVAPLLPLLPDEEDDVEPSPPEQAATVMKDKGARTKMAPRTPREVFMMAPAKAPRVPTTKAPLFRHFVAPPAAVIRVAQGRRANVAQAS